MEKVCIDCGKTKPLSEFHKRSASPDGHMSSCKICRRAYMKRYYQEHREERLAYGAQRYADHGDTIRAYNRQWRAKYAGQEAARVRQWRKEHREQYLENMRAWRRRNPDRVREHNKNIDPAIKLAGNRRRRARLHACGGDFSAADWQRLLEKYDHTCLCCGAQGVPLQADHIVPLSKGGSHTTNNIQPLCGPCNNHKHVKTIDYRNLGHDVGID